MDVDPLVPENLRNHDVTSVLKEAYQEFLRSGDLFPKDIAENLHNAHVEADNMNVKRSGENAVQIDARNTQEHYEMNDAELEIMKKYGISLIRKEDIESNFCVRDNLLLKPVSLIDDLPEESVEKYSLIKKEDLLKNRIEQAIDFQYNEHYHTCKKCLDDEDDVSVYACGQPCEKPVTAAQRKASFPRKSKAKNKTVFSVQPESIVFHNYLVNHTYKATLRVTNTSGRTRALRLTPPAPGSGFSVRLARGGGRLAPGITALLEVAFRPAAHRDLRDSLWLWTDADDAEADADAEAAGQGQRERLEVRLAGYRCHPALRCYVFRTTAAARGGEGPVPGDAGFRNERRGALNNALDCGGGFVGGRAVLSLLLLNEESDAAFFMITEEDWMAGRLQHVNTHMVLETESFRVFPAHFSVAKGELVEVAIEFWPQSYGLHTEQLLLMCNNNTYELLELTGDGILFHKDLLHISILEKDTDGETVMLAKDVRNHCFYLGYLKLQDKVDLILSVTNRSQLTFPYYWLMRTGTEELAYVLPMKSEWVKLETDNECLVAYCTTDIPLHFIFDAETPSYHNIYLSLVVQNIPMDGLYPDLVHTIVGTTHHEHHTDEYMDVQIAEIEFACHLEHEHVAVTQKSTSCAAPVDEEAAARPVSDSVGFSTKVLEFGVLPRGLTVHKSFKVCCNADGPVFWRLAELVMDVDKKPAMALRFNRVSKPSGEFHVEDDTVDVCYEPDTEKCGKFISILILLGSTESGGEAHVMESVCMVVYEVAESNIFIHMEASYVPILCPDRLCYLNTPVTETIYVHNASIFRGCFYFLKPYGEDADDVSVEFRPRSEVLEAGQCRPVEVSVTALRQGVFRRVYVPCFVGGARGQRAPVLRVMCAAAGISVYFYLPRRDGRFTIGLWPRDRPANQHDVSDYSCTCAECISLDDFFTFREESPPFEQDEEAAEANASASASFDTMSEEDAAPPVVLPDSGVLAELKETFGDDLILMNHVSEVLNVSIRKPINIKFYFHNVTPLTAEFSVQCTNYGLEESDLTSPMRRGLIKLKMLPPAQEWDEICLRNGGCIILAQKSVDIVQAEQVVEVDLWAYATTWGTYMEEVVVDIGNLNPFCFTLIVQVVGIPLEFPFAKNTICVLPTYRFGTVWYKSDTVERQISVANTSAVPIHIVWHIFEWNDELTEPFNLILDAIEKDNEEVFEAYVTDGFHGIESVNSCFQNKLQVMRYLLKQMPKQLNSRYKALVASLIEYFEQERNNNGPLLPLTALREVSPIQMNITENSTSQLTIKFNPQHFEVAQRMKTIRATMVGFAIPYDEYMCSLNLYHRRRNLQPCQLVMLASLELPRLQLNLTSGTTRLRMNALRLLAEKQTHVDVTLNLRNNGRADVVASFHIDYPFQVLAWTALPTGTVTDLKQSALIRSRQSVEVTVRCNTPHDYVMEMAEYVYCDRHQALNINKIEKTVEIEKLLNIHHQSGLIEQAIPFSLTLWFPRIEVKPEYIEFGGVLIGQTAKETLEIHNLSECDIKFEIYKSCNNYQIVVKPHYGIVPAKTGTNASFTRITIYFTPMFCECYQHSMRVYTNILPYYVDVPVWGTGTNNRKFDRFNQ